jgi:hypothetical protein
MLILNKYIFQRITKVLWKTFNVITLGLRETDIMDQMKTITGVYKLLKYN